MRQRRICEFFSSSDCPHRRSIFDLSPETRRRIYEYANLVTGYIVELCPKDSSHNPLREEFTDEQSTIFRNLSLTSRDVSAEVGQIFYSSNSFLFIYKENTGFSLLRNFRAQSVQALGSLTIILNSDSCGKNVGYYHVDCERPDGFIRSSCSRHQSMLREWQDTLTNYILVNLHPRLQLHIVADTGDIEAAQLVLDPLLNLPTAPIAACSIRLGPRGNPELQSLADRAALTATGTYRADEPFRFLDLPHELRRHILTYTDLVTPSCEVAWYPAGPFNRAPAFVVRDGESGRCARPNHDIDDEGRYDMAYHAHRGCQHRQCWRAVGQTSCFCRRRHAAASTARNRCRCWEPPLSLFLVCRAVRAESLAVFFRYNRFVVLPDGRYQLGPVGAPPRRLAASVFLADVVARWGMLKHLRKVDVVLYHEHGRSAEALRTGIDPAWADWLRTIEMVAPRDDEGVEDAVANEEDALNLPKLTLKAVFPAYVPYYSEGRYTKEESAAIMAAHGRTLAPLKLWVRKGLNLITGLS